MRDTFDSLQIVIESLKRMETTLLGMKQVRALLPPDPSRDSLDKVIAEAEANFEEIKRRVVN